MNREEFVKQRVAQRASIIEKQIAGVPGSVAKLAINDRRELDLFHFRAFLPFFAGDPEIYYWPNTKEGRAIAMQTWITVAGGPYNEVDVTQTTGTERKVLFTVPATLNRNLVQPTSARSGEPSVYSAVLNANQLMHTSEQYAEQYLKAKLGDRYLRMQHPEVMAANAEAWNKVFAFFQRPLLPTKAELAKAGVSPTDLRDEVIGFDPL